MLLNLSHHCSIATDILYDMTGKTEIDGDQIFCLASVFLGFASLLIWLIIIAVLWSKELMKSGALLLFSRDVFVNRNHLLNRKTL